MRRIILIASLALVVVGVGLWQWSFRSSRLPVSMTEKDGVIEITTTFLGEYALGFVEVKVEDPTSGETLLHTYKGNGRTLLGLWLDSDSDLEAPFVDAGWDISTRASSRTLKAGATYKLTLRGYNGLGTYRETVEIVTLPLEGTAVRSPEVSSDA